MNGENFEISWSQMAINSPHMVGGIFEIYMSEMAKNGLKLSTMVGENFEIYMCENLHV